MVTVIMILYTQLSKIFANVLCMRMLQRKSYVGVSHETLSSRFKRFFRRPETRAMVIPDFVGEKRESPFSVPFRLSLHLA